MTLEELCRRYIEKPTCARYDVLADKVVKLSEGKIAPVVHGHWKYNKKSWWVPECSVCEARPFKGYIPSMDEVKKTYKYCPNCGAEMI